MGLPVKRQNNRVKRCRFKALPVGSTYYVDSDGTGPFVKCGPRAILTANSFPTSNAATAVSDVSIVIKPVPRNYLGQESREL
jgi:hypothetical protein